MPAEGHEAAWPDKAMFAAILLTLAGFFGMLWAALSGAVTLGREVPAFLEAYPPAWLGFTLSLATLGLGLLSLRSQASAYAYLGCATALASMGFLGFVPLLALFALGNLVLSVREGEETRNDGVRMHPERWPDKALAASLFLLVGGLIALFQSMAIATGHFEPVVLKSMPWLAVAYDGVAGAVALAASREVFHLRRSWIGTVAGAACVLTFGFYVFGPLLGVLALVLIALANREGEFLPERAPKAAAAGPPAKKPARAVRASRRSKV